MARRSLVFTAIGAAVIYLLLSQLSQQPDIPVRSSLSDLKDDDIEFIVENMRLAGNTHYYFNLIAPEHVSQMQDEMITFVSEHSAPDELLAEIEALKQDHEAFTRELSKVEVPESFLYRP